jgi:hypothetical protein
MPQLNFTREEIYEMVWAKPVSHIAEELGVKASEIRKYCRELIVPLPEQGHWSRIQFGKSVEQTPLPPLPEPAVKTPPETIPGQNAPDTSATRQVPDELPVFFPGEIELSFRVPDRLIHPDKLILAAEQGLQKEHWVDSYMRRTNDDQVRIRVTQSNIGRALRIMDTLIKCWRRRGYRIEVKDGQTLVYLRQVRQKVSLHEICKTLPKKDLNTSRQLEPTGRLAFRMDWWGGRDWRDGREPLEDQLLAILNHMELSARQIESERENDKVKPEQPKAAPAREPEQTAGSPNQLQQPRRKKKKFKKLLKEAKRWKELQILDEYLAELFSRTEATTEFLEWFKWAKKHGR